MSNALQLDAVGIRRARREVVSDVSLEVGEGEAWALVGLNGAGKSTCIKGLLDLIEISRGRIELFGTPHRRTEARRTVAYLPERFAAPYYLTGREYLGHVAKLRDSEASVEAMSAACARLDLEAAQLDRPLRNYSKGMGQKLGLAACFESGARLLVLDEPMSGLDPRARALVKRELAALADAGRTLFFSSHLLDDVAALATHVAVLHEGALRFAGPLEEFSRRYGEANIEAAFLACIDER